MSHEHPSDYPGTELDAMSSASNYRRWILSKLEPYLGQTVAEVGAGIGSVSELLLASRIKRLVAFEPSQNMFPVLAGKLRHDPRAEAVNDFFGPGYADHGFDSVIYINVLEHIQDDRAELANVFEVLKPDGHLLVFAPALAWLYSDFDRQIGHCRRYTKRGLSDLVKQTGFSLVAAHYFDLVGIIPWYVMFKLLRKSINSRGVSIYDTLAVPPLRLLESLAPPPIGKSVILIARRA